MKTADFDHEQSLANVGKLVDKFGNRFMLLLEQTIYALSDAMVKDYPGGQWAWPNAEHPILVPVDDGVLNVTCHGNFYSDANTDPDAYGHAVSLVAFNHVMVSLGIANEKLVDIYYQVRDHSLDTLGEDAKTQYIQMID